MKKVTKPEEAVRAVVDTKTRRPACVLLQAIYGGDRWVANLVESAFWHLAPTDHMATVSGTREQWRKWAVEVEQGKRPKR